MTNNVTMNTSYVIPTRKWRKRRNQNFGSVMLALNHIREQFYKRSTLMKQSHDKLQASKKELSEIIKEVRKLEKSVKIDKDRCKESIGLLKEEVDQAEVFCRNSSNHSGMNTLQTWAKVEIITARKKIGETEFELNSRNSIVLKNNNSDERPSTTFIAPITIDLSDIDQLGKMTKGESIKIDYSRKCCICLERDIDCIFYLCAHQCCCSTCASDIKKNKNSKCPVCRRNIKKVIKTYYV